MTHSDLVCDAVSEAMARLTMDEVLHLRSVRDKLQRRLDALAQETPRWELIAVKVVDE